MRPPYWLTSLIAAASMYAASAVAAPMVVYLDFVSRTGAGEYAYSAAERNLIQTNIAADYALFDYSFTQTMPLSGNFSTLFFNSGPQGGLAQDIDFRNLNRNDTAQININGLAAGSAAVVSLSSFIGAHELGHLAGLRHGDSFGAIGQGIHNPPGGSPYLPDYPGPTTANETTSSLMASPASVGQLLSEANESATFNERSAVKLAFNEQPNVIAEQAGVHGSIATAQAITLAALNVPNPLPALGRMNSGKLFDVDAFVVTGAIGVNDENDFYSFTADAGDLFNFEVISGVPNRIANPIDSVIRVRDSSGAVIAYYSGTAVNDDEFESTDSILIDLRLQSTGTYFIEVDTFGTADTGNYELFGYRFAAFDNTPIPEPGTLMLGLVGVALAGAARRRQRLTA
jgi:Bacterial pre-peptidase C-terminal domain/PEP-CTERM motif